MQTIFIIIKGQAADAERAAQTRGIEMTVTGESSNWAETYCEAPMSERAKVIEWYASEGIAKAAEIGEIIWYAYRD